MCDLTTLPDCLAVVIARRKQLQMAEINWPRQLVKAQSSKRVLQAGAEKRRAREGEGARRGWDGERPWQDVGPQG